MSSPLAAARPCPCTLAACDGASDERGRAAAEGCHFPRRGYNDVASDVASGVFIQFHLQFFPTCVCRKSFFLSIFQILVDLRQPQVDPKISIIFHLRQPQVGQNRDWQQFRRASRK